MYQLLGAVFSLQRAKELVLNFYKLMVRLGNMFLFAFLKGQKKQTYATNTQAGRQGFWLMFPFAIAVSFLGVPYV